MPTSATTRRVGGVVVIDFAGQITTPDGTGLLRDTVKQLVAAGHKNILLNLRNLTYLDSGGMGELVGACSTLRGLGGDLKLLHPQERVENLLRMTKLFTVFEVFSDEPAALQSF